MSDEVVEDDESGAVPDEPTAVDVPMAYGVPVTEYRDMTVLHASAEQLLETATALRDDSYLMCLDVTVVDYSSHPGRKDLPVVITPTRFEAVYHFISHEKVERIRIRVQVPEEDLTVPSLFDLYPGTEYTEREAHDMFGVIFDNHPDLTRILMPEDWNGYPLRKDYNVGAIPVQFKDAPSRR